MASEQQRFRLTQTISDAVFWKPGQAARWAIVFSAGIASIALASLHLIAGLAYEFHLFFAVPVFVVAWYLGRASGYATAIVVVALWFAADLRLDDDQSDAIPLLFNSVIRIFLFVSGVSLLTGLRSVLDRESRLAREDVLTGLPNRREFHEQGNRAIALAHRQGIPVTAVFIDLDHFKEVNDTCGHKAGDEVLVAVADILRTSLRASDLSGRLGGDEFALLLPGMNSVDAERYIKRVRYDLIRGMELRNWPVRFSIGMASYDQTPVDFSAVIASADALMYEVKRGGRDRILQRVFVLNTG